jgi:hypothetical protein
MSTFSYYRSKTTFSVSSRVIKNRLLWIESIKHGNLIACCYVICVKYKTAEILVVPIYVAFLTYFYISVFYFIWFMSRVSAGSIRVSRSVWLRAGRPGNRAGAKDFPYSLCGHTGSGAHPASCTMCTGGPFPGAKARPGRDADHSHPSSVEVEYE